MILKKALFSTVHVGLIHRIRLGGICGLGVLSATPAFAWGERGHAIVTQVATRLFVARAGPSPQGSEPLVKPFRDKELMLAHLSNVPDIVWRNLPREQTALLNPAHWINVEYLGMTTPVSIRPVSLPEALALAVKHCKESRLEALTPCDAPPSNVASSQLPVSKAPPRSGPQDFRMRIFGEVGSAPWRIEQLSEELTQGLVATAKAADSKNSGRKARGSSSSKGSWFPGAKATPPMSSAAEKHMNDALIAAGLLSHYVADLGQPLHTSRDFDGYETGQGGLHSYYETQIVGELDLGLMGRVFEQAKTLDVERLSSAPRISGRTPRDLAFVLAAHSYGQIPVVQALDRKLALVEPSSLRNGLKIPSSRKPAAQVAQGFDAVVTEHLAWSAVVLAEIYWRAWVAADRPDLSGYSSYVYALSAPPVPTTYLHLSEQN